MPAEALFVTGTDTGCGKTRASLALIAHYRARGERVLGMKPIASGSAATDEGLRNADALALQAAASGPAPYALVNPYAFAPPIAPHLAAAEAGAAIRLGPIADALAKLRADTDRVIVEGVGGWRVPLGTDLEVADLPARLELPVVLVVGLRLGCLNHALLSAESIARRGCRLCGWIGNRVEPGMARLEANLETLRRAIAAPCWGVLPWAPGRPPDGSELNPPAGPRGR